LGGGGQRGVVGRGGAAALPAEGASECRIIDKMAPSYSFTHKIYRASDERRPFCPRRPMPRARAGAASATGTAATPAGSRRLGARFPALRCR
jgi:hypothetical protein